MYFLKAVEKLLKMSLLSINQVHCSPIILIIEKSKIQNQYSLCLRHHRNLRLHQQQPPPSPFPGILAAIPASPPFKYGTVQAKLFLSGGALVPPVCGQPSVPGSGLVRGLDRSACAPLPAASPPTPDQPDQARPTSGFRHFAHHMYDPVKSYPV